MLLPSLHIVQEGGSVRNVVRILHGRRQECKWAILCGVSCTYSSANPNENVLISFKLPQQQLASQVVMALGDQKLHTNIVISYLISIIYFLKPQF
ncbi:uncharacterized protein LOC128293197 isoform X2 [Gossypium arboreum]|uniref:uncharacterized protein LOC128293192 isoform X2 n=1 Tax=Gossypium arboreum TaxID=29729 RepID=UPI0022F17B72|nr:uncharacterized protein LOC128293192 isoform X2 [Gossypium arboreum]XP_052884816.1 uncharacterized protein LOC128293197 isoform X2 [Gossypium arboreum]